MYAEALELARGSPASTARSWRSTTGWTSRWRRAPTACIWRARACPSPPRCSWPRADCSSVARCTRWTKRPTAAADGADYLTFGHVFPTTTHPGLPPRGLTELRGHRRRPSTCRCWPSAASPSTTSTPCWRPAARASRSSRPSFRTPTRVEPRRACAPRSTPRPINPARPSEPAPTRRERMQLIVNQQPFEFASDGTGRPGAAGQPRRDAEAVAVAVNGEVVPAPQVAVGHPGRRRPRRPGQGRGRRRVRRRRRSAGHRRASRSRSRLLMGTGRFVSPSVLRAALERLGHRDGHRRDSHDGRRRQRPGRGHPVGARPPALSACCRIRPAR